MRGRACCFLVPSADAFAANVRPIIREIQASRITSLRGVAKALTARGIKTARGGAGSEACSPPH